MPVEGDPDRRLGGLGELDRDDGLDAKRRLRAETAADVLGDDPNLGGIELEPLGDLGFELGHRLGRGMDRQFVAVEAGDRRVRLEAGVLLDAGPERPLEQQRIACRPGALAIDPRADFFLSENAAVGPRTLPDHDAGAAAAFAGVVPSAPCPCGNRIGASALRAASGPITLGRIS